MSTCMCSERSSEREREPPASVATYQRDQSPKKHKYTHTHMARFTVDM